MQIDLNHGKSRNFEKITLLSSQGLSARLDRDNKTCYVSKLDSSLPSPEKMKQEMDQVS